VSNRFLVRLLSEAAITASDINITAPIDNLSDNAYYDIFPGEHYRLLKAISAILQPDLIVEVGTHSGKGSIALSQGFNDSKVITYDIVPHNNYESQLTHSISKNIS